MIQAKKKQRIKIIKELVEISDMNAWTIRGMNIDEYRKKTVGDKVGDSFDKIRGY